MITAMLGASFLMLLMTGRRFSVTPCHHVCFIAAFLRRYARGHFAKQLRYYDC